MDTLLIYLLLASAQHQLPTNLLASICYVESRHNVNAIHKADGLGNSVGACQIKLATAKHVGFKGTEKQLMDPQVNAYYAGKYLKYQINRYKGDYARAITAYNRGKSTGDGDSAYYRKVKSVWTPKVYSRPRRLFTSINKELNIASQ